MRTKPVIFLLLFLPSLLLSSGEAVAAPRGLFILGDFNHWVELEYRYDGQETKTKETSSRSQNYFKEEYNGQIAYAILDPRLWRGKLSAGVSLDQGYYSSNASSRSSSGRSFKYNFTGAALEKSAFPLHLFGRSELIHAQREFSNPYDINLDTYGLNFSLKNRYLPVRLDYTRTTTETTGLVSDRIQESDTVSLEMSHNLGKISHTNGRISFFDNNSKSKLTDIAAENKTYEASLRNQLSLSKSIAGRTLISHLLARQETWEQNIDRQEVKTYTLEEQVVWPFGRALTSGVNYSFTSRESFRGKDQYHNGRIWIQHRLFESLTTQLDGDFRKDDLVTGTEQNVAGAIGLLYQKKLPWDSQFQLNFNQLYQVTDRNQSGVSQLLVDEPHTAVADPVIPGLVPPILLRNGNVAPESIVIRNADPSVRLLPYVVNVDYGVQQTGLQTQIVILPGSDIVVGDNLLINYLYLANPQVGYSTSTRRIGFNLPLFNYLYRFYGSWLDSRQELLSGRADLIRLTGQTAYKLGFETNRLYFSCGAEYEDVDSDQDKHQTILGFLRHSHRFGRGTLSLYTSDAYTKTRPNSFTGSGVPDRTVNSLSAGGTYSAQLFSTAQMSFTAKYFNLSGDALGRDDVSLGLNIRWNYGKISVSLLSQVNWRMLPGTTTRDEYLRLHLTRYF